MVIELMIPVFNTSHRRINISFVCIYMYVAVHAHCALVLLVTPATN